MFSHSRKSFSFELPRIYPITDTVLSRLSHGEQVRQLAEAGCRFIQIRGKKATSNEFFQAVSESLKVAERFGTMIIVNDRVDIAVAARAAGVHLGQDDLSAEAARRLLGDNAIIGHSTHSVEQAIAAAGLPIDYIAIGPVFATTTKANPDPIVGLEGIARVRNAIGDLPLVAIGGINSENLADVLNAGADSAAIIGDLFASGAHIGEHFTELMNIANNA